MNSKKVLKQIIISIAALGIIAMGIGIYFADNILYWVLGIAAGTAISMLKVIMLERTLDRAVDMPPEDAKNYTRSRYTFRMILSIAAVVVAIKLPWFNVIGVIVGLLLVQPAVYIVNFTGRNNK